MAAFPYYDAGALEALGAELAKSVESRAQWVANREAQITVNRANLVAEIQKMLRKS